MKTLIAITSLLFLGALPAALAEVTLPNLFSDHMVLQREMKTPVWGKAAPGEAVTVKFRDQTQTVTAGPDGAWKVTLDSLKAGGPDELTVNTLVIKNVLVGDVWVGSGQSNMAGSVAGYSKNDPTLAEVAAKAPFPMIRFLKIGATAGWSEATPQAVAGFSALHFAFGQKLQAELNVPIGLMQGAVGGTPSGSWLTEAALGNDAEVQKQIAEFAKTYDLAKETAAYERYLKAYEENVAKLKAADPAARLPRKPWAPVNPGQHMRGDAIGHLYERFIQPAVGYGIRGVLWDQGEGGTAILGADQYVVMGALIQSWREAWGQGEFPFLYVQKPSGGGCAYDPANPITREGDKFQPEPATVPTGGDSKALHIRIRQHPNTWMVTSTDLGGMTHPLNKWGYGQRAALVAMKATYGKDTTVYGPSYVSHAVEGGAVKVTFGNLGGGLEFKHGDRLQGFAVAGEDKIFHWAKAEIQGDTVVLKSDAVPAPVAVRYAWASSHPWANLFNKAGLPAETFRTDTW